MHWHQLAILCFSLSLVTRSLPSIPSTGVSFSGAWSCASWHSLMMLDSRSVGVGGVLVAVCGTLLPCLCEKASWNSSVLSLHKLVAASTQLRASVMMSN